MQSFVKLVECPRDAMQGWPHLIPTSTKIAYINQLLDAGFDTIDFGSFVSPKAIPQMADTTAVLQGLNLEKSRSKLLAIVANERGANEAVAFDEINLLGFPFSISPVFQQRNANSGIAASVERVAAIQELCLKNDKQLVVYISMAFGNPYGDAYSEELVYQWVGRMVDLGIQTISLADTVGLASPEQVFLLLETLIPRYADVEIGVHLHSTALNWKQKVDAALRAGCLRFDGALKGIGGCPMAGDDLVGNMDTELMVPYFTELGLMKGIDTVALQRCSKMAAEVFI